ncbi:hypothetical protein PsorP6_017561 [Peronosclerospora sorghi]|uniref:Uncharacterized protein n=1 Tax=Peronosclerospora sorghi TaxID=230839 RepID=A0ACC0WMN4_9STRA|nr:hypothetical protein PsorP6_017561 [Peronosclerospora sorghi]
MVEDGEGSHPSTLLIKAINSRAIYFHASTRVFYFINTKAINFRTSTRVFYFFGSSTILLAQADLRSDAGSLNASSQAI